MGFFCKWAGEPLCTFFFHTQAKPNFNFSFFESEFTLDYRKMLDFPMLTKVNDPMKLLQMVFTKSFGETLTIGRVWESILEVVLLC